MKRATLFRSIAVFAVVILASVHHAEAQEHAKVPRIGLLNPFSAPPKHGKGDRLGDATVQAFHQGLQDLGYVPGKNIHIEYRWAEGNLARLGALAADLVGRKVDILVTVSMKGVRAARKATATIPIVSGGAGDLVRGGLITSLAQPGGNITGLTDINPELNGKQLELLKVMMPGLSRVAFLYAAVGDVKTTELHLQEAQVAAKNLGLQLQLAKVRDVKALPDAYTALKKQGAEALVTVLSGFTLHHRKKLVEHAAAHRLPAMYQGREFTEAGGLISYGTDRLDQWRRAATYVDKILRGTKPAALPVGQPRKLELIVNLKTAKALGLEIPSFILYKADKVIR